MSEALGNLLERRSIRAYKPEQISEDELQSVLKAGLLAPSAMNRQPTAMLVVQDKDTIALLSKLNAKVMGKDIDPFYGAPTVIVVLADRNVPTYIEDGALVLGNLMNAANAVGLGSCWVNRAKEVFEMPEAREILRTASVTAFSAMSAAISRQPTPRATAACSEFDLNEKRCSSRWELHRFYISFCFGECFRCNKADENKQREHRHSDPLVRRLAHEAVGQSSRCSCRYSSASSTAAISACTSSLERDSCLMAYCSRSSSALSGAALSVIAAAFFGVDSEHEHERAQGILRARNVNGISVGPVEKLLCYDGDRFARWRHDRVVPAPEITLDLPTVEVDIELGLKECKSLCYTADVFICTGEYLELRLEQRQHLFAHRAYMAAACVQNMQHMPPAELTLHREHASSALIVNIIAVKPREKALLEK